LEKVNQRLQYLINRCNSGQLSSHEWQELRDLATEENREEYASLLAAQFYRTEEILPAGETAWEEQIRMIVDIDKVSVTAPSVKRMPLLRRWWAAASVLLLLSAGYYWWMVDEKKITPQVITANSKDVAPGRQGAILTLADGSRVLIDTLKNGVVAMQGGVVARVVNGVLRYEGGGTEIVYNTMSTPKGRQFQLTLPDGSNVWLNAASSIRYPATFTGAERKVEVTGEVYFEIARNSRLPFSVVIDQRAVVQVLGTSFNVNAYQDEELINTTLLEGSIKVGRIQNSGTGQHREQSIILKEGQQIQITQYPQDGLKIIDTADLEKVMAWKNGLFNFNDMPLRTAMNQLARWYDIDIEYEGEIPDRIFYGEITRDLSLSQLLLLLKDIDIRYEIKERTLIIKP
jgi:transmembrane sensor